MKAFHCSNCQTVVFFENVLCLRCGEQLAYLPDRAMMAAMRPEGNGLWRPLGVDDEQSSYRACINRTEHDVCNWAIPVTGDAEPLCSSCRLTRVIPDISLPGNRTAWYRMEVAKRRLIYTLNGLCLPLQPTRAAGDGGVVFEFRADGITPNGDSNRVLTGHDNGVITINVAEADDLLREQQRLQQNEPYRTLLGHFRHEIGHYYWDRLIQDGNRQDAFRAMFGDERDDYAAALQRHYERGPPADWDQHFVSAYSSAHPWEDWAESWAHYLHMTDALETASSTGLSLRPARSDEPSMSEAPDPLRGESAAFDRMVDAWLALTYVLNSLNRGLGRPDGYPFVLSAPVIDKLRFVHQVIHEAPAIVATPIEDSPTGHSYMGTGTALAATA
jgi:hypothetical protein